MIKLPKVVERNINEISHNSIKEAVCHWLGYQSAIGRERLIHEASLRYPVADSITSGTMEINSIYLEKGHPSFKKRLVDIFLLNEKENSISVKTIRAIFELKLSKRNTGTKFSNENQRVIDDILRLAYFNLHSEKEAYFLICGTRDDFEKYFIGNKRKEKLTKKDNGERLQAEEKQGVSAKTEIALNKKQGVAITTTETELTNLKEWKAEKSLYKKYFSFGVNTSQNYTFAVTTQTDTNESDKDKKRREFGLYSFQKEYIIKNESIKYEESISIKTTCMAITLAESSGTHACGIWKIEAVK